MNGVAKDRTLTKGWSMYETGATTDNDTRVNAYIMLATSLLYFTVEIPALMGYDKSPTAASA